MHLNPWYYDFLFNGDHALATTAQIRCGLSIEEITQLTARPPEKPTQPAATEQQERRR